VYADQETGEGGGVPQQAGSGALGRKGRHQAQPRKIAMGLVRGGGRGGEEVTRRGPDSMTHDQSMAIGSRG